MDSYNYILAFERCAATFPTEVIGKCVDIGKKLVWDADAVGELQHISVNLAIKHINVFVTKYKDFITSFITCKIKNEIGNIGLIATHENHRGKSLGRNLINHVHHWYLQNNIKVSEVVTQKANKIACAFYENYGFQISKEELVYHWHFKK
jgi:GNAT superfamily N-acetyltransferase